jgi:hypothetical protein
VVGYFFGEGLAAHSNVVAHLICIGKLNKIKGWPTAPFLTLY